jgi:hypothetical protein
MRKIASLCIAILALALSAHAQSGPSCKLPVNLDQLAAKAAEVVDVSMDENMLKFAGGFLKKDNPGEVQAQKLLSGIRNLCVHSFKFDKEGQYAETDVELLRSQFQSPTWSRMVGVQNKRGGENVDVLFKMENGVIAGLAVVAAKPMELTFVQIDGTIDLSQLAALGGQFGIPKVDMSPKSKPAAKADTK